MDKRWIFKPLIIIPSIVLGCVLSFYVGLITWNQSKENYNSLEQIEQVKAKLESITSSDKPKLVGSELTEYNKKVANSRMLLITECNDPNLIENEYLSSLVKGCKENANKSFAVKNVGRIIALLTAIFSLIMTIPSIWLFITAAYWFFNYYKRIKDQSQ